MAMASSSSCGVWPGRVQKAKADDPQPNPIHDASHSRSPQDPGLSLVQEAGPAARPAPQKGCSRHRSLSVSSCFASALRCAYDCTGQKKRLQRVLFLFVSSLSSSSRRTTNS
nr:unnamed protein product [Digitaria exilis]